MLFHRRLFGLYLKEIADIMEDRTSGGSLRSESGVGHPPVNV